MECAKKHQIDGSPVRPITSSLVTRAFFPRLLLILAIPVLLGGLLQACGGGGGGAPVTNLKSLTIEPVDSSIAVGTKVQLHATGTFKDKTTKDLTASVTWESADTSVAIISNQAVIKGLAGGTGVGATTVRAKLHGVKGISTFTVTQASLKSITVLPVNPVVARGTTVQMAAIGNFSDGTVQNLSTQVSWSSANNSIAQVSNASGTQGLVTTVSVGNTPITATFNGIQGATTVTVTAATLTSITITVPVTTIAKGTTVQLTATCNFSDGTTQDCTNQVSWTSGNSGIVQVSNTAPSKGLVTGVGVGNTTISGSLGGIQGSETATVTAATLTSITITPPGPSIPKGTKVQLTATGNFTDGSTENLTTQVSWISGDNTIAQVSNVAGTLGLVTGLKIGNTTISANLNGVEGSATVTVGPPTLTSITITVPAATIAKGTTAQLTATGNFTDGSTEDLTRQVSWTSADNSVAEVSNVSGSEGLVTGINLGNTTIMTTLNGVVGSATVTVSAATLTSITVTPPSSSIPRITTTPLTATCNFSDKTTQNCTNQVSWTSANETVAQVSNVSGTEGRVTGLVEGSSLITATASPSLISGSATVTVTAAILTSITITPPNPSVPVGIMVQLTATGNLSDGSTADLTDQVSWTSGNNAIAEVSGAQGTEGLLTGLSMGSTSITASFSGTHTSTTVTVTAATLTSITVTPPNPEIPRVTTTPLTATCNFSDKTTHDCTNQVSWTSANEAVAQVSNVSGTEGLVTGLVEGSSLITATASPSSISGSTTVTVTPAIVQTIIVSPQDQSIALGTHQQMKATCNFTDSTTQDCTNTVSWTSADDTNAPVSNTMGSQGLVTGHGLANNVQITATATDGIEGSTTVTVTAATLSFISLLPAGPVIAKGTNVQLTATGHFSDGTTQDLTNSASWTSDNPAVATVGNTGSLLGAGEVHGVSVGGGVTNPVTITATQMFPNGTFQGHTTVTVSAAALDSIAVTPAVNSIPKGIILQLTAIGTFSDGTTQDLTATASWISANPAVATVGNSSNLLGPGRVQGVGVGGPVTITATQGTVPVSGTATVTVTSAIVTAIIVTPADPTLAEHDTLQMIATAVFSDGTMEDVTQQADWTSSDDTVAHIISSSSPETNGELMAKKAGTATITATVPTLGNAQGSTVVTVM
jgi:trimeric autotransporter adhesin